MVPREVNSPFSPAGCGRRTPNIPNWHIVWVGTSAPKKLPDATVAKSGGPPRVGYRISVFGFEAAKKHRSQ